MAQLGVEQGAEPADRLIGGHHPARLQPDGPLVKVPDDIQPLAGILDPLAGADHLYPRRLVLAPDLGFDLMEQQRLARYVGFGDRHGGLRRPVQIGRR